MVKLRVEPDWHQAIVGTTGSGKTTLLRMLIASYGAKMDMERKPLYYKIWVLDTKQNGDFEGIGTHYEHAEEAIQDKQSRIVVYSPSADEDDYVYYELFVKLIWERWMVDPTKRNKVRVPAVIVVDELGMLEIPQRNKSYTDPNKTHYWSQVMKRGRGSKVILWNATQNPVWVPEDFLRLANSFFAFRLNEPADRNKMAGYMGPEVKQPILDPYGFWYYNFGGMLHPHYFKKLNVNISTGQSSTNAVPRPQVRSLRR